MELKILFLMFPYNMFDTNFMGGGEYVCSVVYCVYETLAERIFSFMKRKPDKNTILILYFMIDLVV